MEIGRLETFLNPLQIGKVSTHSSDLVYSLFKSNEIEPIYNWTFGPSEGCGGHLW